MKAKKTIKSKTKVTKKKATKKKSVKRKKSKRGRKELNGRSERAVVLKLEKAFEQGCSVNEARNYAEISKTAYYHLLERKPELKDRFEDFMFKPILIARTEVVKGLAGDKEFSLKFLERKMKSEFAPHSTIQAEVEVHKLSDERKAGIMERLEKWKKK